MKTYKTVYTVSSRIYIHIYYVYTCTTYRVYLASATARVRLPPPSTPVHGLSRPNFTNESLTNLSQWAGRGQGGTRVRRETLCCPAVRCAPVIFVTVEHASPGNPVCVSRSCPPAAAEAAASAAAAV